MPRCVTKISFVQIGIDDNGTQRNLGLSFDFVHEFEANDSWTSLTNSGKITVPKNLYFTDSKTGQAIGLQGAEKDKWIENLFRKGDAVTINYGYYTYDESGNEFLDMDSENVFFGFVSAVESGIPITLALEDTMWILKQTPCPNMVWDKTKTVEQLMKLLTSSVQVPTIKDGAIVSYPITINALTESYVGDLQIQNESVAQLIERLRKDFHLEAYFKGNELRIGSFVYVEDKSGNPVNKFTFQRNIISNDLIFTRKDDIKLSAICESINTVFTGKQNKQGEDKTKQERLTVLVYWDENGIPRYKKKEKNVDLPANLEGERRKLFYPNINSAATLAQAGLDELNKYYYTGFKGSFVTFAIPRVKLGDYIYLEDTVLPDRNGYYVVKAVDYSGGVNGHRQKITLDYKLVVTNKQVQSQKKVSVS